MVEEENARDPLFVGSLERGMRLLQAFREDSDTLGLTELAQITGLTKSAAQRFAHTWEQLGYLQKDPRSRRFRLGVKVVELGFFFMKGQALIGRAIPHLMAARDRTGLAINLSLLDGADILYVVRLPRQGLTLAEMLVGRRMPAYCTSSGRALLSHYDDATLHTILSEARPKRHTPQSQIEPEILFAEIVKARQQGFAITREQLLIGQIGVGTVVPAGEQRPMAAVNMTMTTDQWDEARIIREVVPQLMMVAEAIHRG